MHPVSNKTITGQNTTSNSMGLFGVHAIIYYLR